VGLGWVCEHIVEVGNLFCNWVEFSKEIMWTFATAILVYLNLLEYSTELRYGHPKEPKEDGIGKKQRVSFPCTFLL
jgi:hypothetical protein